MDDERLTLNKGLQPLVSTTDPDDPLTLNMELHNKGLQPLVDADSMDEERLYIQKQGAAALVKMMTCTREHAFRPEYKGGFDVVIGNPPYVDIKALPKHIVDYIFKTYSTANNRINLFSVFIEKSLHILKLNGRF
ncbi:MAG: Eco57I restriction-modification methylase domain-containing protein [Bacteroidales bacterium]|nr:Eco57I restriction-modification methylase domain-containing protein [Bacteroidales bacterium]